jgi:hypothetical protein
MWRRKIEQGVSEGNTYVEYVKSLSPKVGATTKATKTAIKLIQFQIVDISKVQLQAKSTKKQRAAEFTLDIINTTHIAEPIKLSYLSSREESTTDDDSRNSEDATSELSQWIDGSAIKLAMNRWQVIVSNGDNFIVDEEDLLDNEQYFVKQAFETEGKLQKQRQAQKAKYGTERA